MTDLHALGFRNTPFTREVRASELLTFPFLDEALAGLVNAVEHRMSAALIAPAGTGKTSLLRRLVTTLPEARFDTRYVKVTDLSKRDMCREICVACGAQPAGSYPMLVRRLQERFVGSLDNDGRRPVLVLDEAHDLRHDVLAMLRVLTNFMMDSRLVLSVLLCGQPPLRQLLAREDQEAIARRLVFYGQLRLLSRAELDVYVEHRCTLAGAATVPFDGKTVDAIHELGKGNLRTTDDLALRSLELAATAGKKVVSVQHVIAARKELWP
jgi:general secretion pathway protein A